MRPRSFNPRRITRLLVASVLLGLTLASSAQAVTMTIPGNPMTIYVNDTGGVTGRVAGQTTNVFFPPSQNDAPDAGFNLGFPAGIPGNSTPITYGPVGSASFTAISQSPVTGAGTAASPYSVTTVYRVPIPSAGVGVDVTQVVTYVNGASRFAISYTVQNLTSTPIRFRAGEYADLYLADDTGTGFLNPGPPRLVGGLNVTSGRAGGIEEAGSAWDRYETGGFSTVSSNLADLAGPGLTNTVDPTDLDNGVAVQWDDHFAVGNGLGVGGIAGFQTAWAFSGLAPPTPAPAVDNSLDAQLARLPAPVLGKTLNVGLVKGDVFIKVPAKTARTAQAKGGGFVRLTQARQIPVGSLLDTKKGTVRLVSATRTGGKQQGDFTAGFFTALQSRRGRSRGIAELRMSRGKFTGCTSKRRGGKAQSARRSKRVIRRLRGDARGRFRTRGKYSSATVRGTDWTVTDRCDGTLTKVRRGSVVVRDLRRRKNVIVKAGRSRLVRAPR